LTESPLSEGCPAGTGCVNGDTNSNSTIDNISELDNAIKEITKQSQGESQNVPSPQGCPAGTGCVGSTPKTTSLLDSLNPFKPLKTEAQTVICISGPCASGGSTSGGVSGTTAPSSGTYYISLLQNPNLKIDVRDGNTADQSKLTIWNANGGVNQKWLWDSGNGKIQGLAGKCIDSGSGTAGDFLRIHSCHGGWNQKWGVYYDQTLRQRNPNTGREMCVTTQGGNVEGANLIVNECAANECGNYWNLEQFPGYDRSLVPEVCGGTKPTPPAPTVQPPITGNHKILNLFNKGLAMDISGSSTANQTRVQYWSDNNSNAQKWSYMLDNTIRGLGGKCLDSGSGTNNDWLRIHDCTGNNNQKWSVNRDYGITQGNLCIGADSMSSGSTMRLKECQVNACTTYLEYGAYTNSYSPSQVYAKGCGSFSVGGSSYSGSPSYTPPVTTPSTPTSYTPPVNGYVPPVNTQSGTGAYPEGAYLGNIKKSKYQLAVENLSSGYTKAVPRYDKPGEVVGYYNKINAFRKFYEGAVLDVKYCLNKPNWIDVIGCGATSSTFNTAKDTLIKLIASLFEGFGAGFGEAFTWQNLVLAIGAAIVTSGMSFVNQIALGFGIIAGKLTYSLFTGDAQNSASNFVNASMFDQAKAIGRIVGNLVGSIVVGTVGAGVASLGTTLVTAGNSMANNAVDTILGLWRGRLVPEFAGYGGLSYYGSNGTLSLSKVELLAFAKNSSAFVIGSIGSGKSNTSQIDDSAVEENVRIVNEVEKGTSPIWRGFSNYKGKTKTNGLDGKNRKYFEWDNTHKDIEVYNSDLKHLGTMDAVTGEMYKPAVPFRTITIN
jgi:Ricin-type beta-trefoil lectin domain/Cytotoxic